MVIFCFWFSFILRCLSILNWLAERQRESSQSLIRVLCLMLMLLETTLMINTRCWTSRQDLRKSHKLMFVYNILFPLFKQTLKDPITKTYSTHSECSIEFEVDGPYKVKCELHVSFWFIVNAIACHIECLFGHNRQWSFQLQRKKEFWSRSGMLFLIMMEPWLSSKVLRSKGEVSWS